MISTIATLERAPCPADPLVFSSPANSSAHAELLSICERLAGVWDERARSESELWEKLKLELSGTSNITEALHAFSENAAQRVRITLENAQRIFDEQQQMAARFSRPQE
jgi:hypothetical protein